MMEHESETSNDIKNEDILRMRGLSASLLYQILMFNKELKKF